MRRREFLAAAVSASVAGSAGCVEAGDRPLEPTAEGPLAVDGEWRQTGGGPGHARAGDGSGPGDSYQSYWRYAGREGESLTPVAVVDGTVYATADAAVVGVDAARGREEWRVTLGDGDDESAPPDSPVGGEAPVTVGRDRLYLPKGWLPRDARGSQSLARYPETSTADRAALAGEAFVYARDERVVAADGGDGVPRWTHEVDGTAVTRIACEGGVVCVADDDRLYGLSLATGDELWSVSGLYDFAGPVGQSGRFYYVDHGGVGTVVAVSALTGERVWTHDLGFRAYVSAGHDRVVLGATARHAEKREVVVLDADGERLWETPAVTNDWTYQPPVVADGAVYSSTVAGVFAYDLETGEERYELSADYARQVLGDGLYPVEGPIVVGSAMFLSADGDLYGLGPA